MTKWKSYPPDPRYQVSDSGRVIGPSGKELTSFLHKNYMRFGINNKPTAIHVLMLESFVGPRPKGMEGCHWDDDKMNNTLDNLRWGTKADNVQDSVRNGTHVETRKTHCPLNHPLEEPNLIKMSERHRKCRACHNASNAISRHKRKHGVDITDEHESRAHAQYERLTHGLG